MNSNEQFLREEWDRAMAAAPKPITSWETASAQQIMDDINAGWAKLLAGDYAWPSPFGEAQHRATALAAYRKENPPPFEAVANPAWLLGLHKR